jgi:hypothetical protein
MLRGLDWRAEFARLRAHEVNFIELTALWPGALPAAQQQAALRSLDSALIEAERTGRLGVQLKLACPPDVADNGAGAYETQLLRWVRRWSYSPALATWYVAGAHGEVPPQYCARFVQLVRANDPYSHLVAVPGLPGEDRAGADLQVQPWNWQRPANRFALMEVPDRLDGPRPLPGETSWQNLVLGGVGLPLWPYRPGAADGADVLQRIARMARVAGRVPYQAGGTPVTGIVPVDSPGTFCRYGDTLVGWLAPEESRLGLPALPPGRYRVRFWDPETDNLLAQRRIAWDPSRRLDLPAARALYLQLDRLPAPAAPAPKPAAANKPREAEKKREVAKKEAARKKRQSAAKKRSSSARKR